MEHNRVDGAATIGAHSVHPSARRWPYLWPLAVFVIVGVFLAVGLTLNPRSIPSPLLGKPIEIPNATREVAATGASQTASVELIRFTVRAPLAKPAPPPAAPAPPAAAPAPGGKP